MRASPQEISSGKRWVAGRRRCPLARPRRKAGGELWARLGLEENSIVYDLSVSGTTVCTARTFTSFNGQARQNLAFNGTTGALPRSIPARAHCGRSLR